MSSSQYLWNDSIRSEEKKEGMNRKIRGRRVNFLNGIPEILGAMTFAFRLLQTEREIPVLARLLGRLLVRRIGTKCFIGQIFQNFFISFEHIHGFWDCNTF